jgi:hypothetical protein
MHGDDLRSMPGLEDKHRKALARRQVTTLHGLVHADRRVLYRSMGNIRPRPTLEQIAQWQDTARGKLNEPVLDTSDWHTAVSFAVVFAQRKTGDAWERRLEVERTEVEPERDPEVWSGWDCKPICGWMLGQLGLTYSSEATLGADGAEAVPKDGTGDAQRQPADEQADKAVSPAVRPQLRIDNATLIDATRRAEVVTAGVVVADPPAELISPVRAVLTVSGARPGTPVHAVARFRRRGSPSWNPENPVIVQSSGQAEFDLSRVPAGQHEMALVAWAPDAAAKLVSVRLPTVTIRCDSH